MRFVILHYHIFKNSGTTIEWFLYHNCGERFRTLDTEDRDQAITNADLLRFLHDNPGVEAISSHQMYDPVPCVPGFIFYDICFLRDPLDRIRSVYDYFREKPVAGDPISDLANTLPIGDYVARLIKDFPWTINDVQVNQLANGRINDQPNGPQDLERATERILNTSFLGVVDRFDESLIAGQHALRVAFSFRRVQEPVNVSRGLEGTLAARMERFRAACDERTYAEIVRLNRMDLELLDRARAEVERRFRRVPNGAARLRVLRGQSEPEAVDEPEAEVPAAQKTFPIRRAGNPSFLTKTTRLVRALLHIGIFWPRKHRTKLFDPDYYRASNPDVAERGSNALLHFIVAGAFEGRNPHPLFDTSFYLRENPGVAASGINPLVHYLRSGGAAGRNPHPVFDSAFYLNRHADVRQAGINPLVHYVANGAAERRKPHPYFEPHHYLRRCDFGPWIDDALIHFLGSHRSKIPNPHVLFDCESYLSENVEAARLGINPLVHYLLSEAGRSNLPVDLSVSEVEIRDVKVPIKFLNRAADGDAQRYDTGRLAVVWKDSDGRTDFAAAASQRPFFEGVSYDQLRAQAQPSAWPFARALSDLHDMDQPVALERIDGC